MNYSDYYQKLPDYLRKLINWESYNSENINDKLTSHFIKKELTCQCGCGFLPHPYSIAVLELIRVRTAKAFRITSGARCRRHNLRIRGAKNSDHLRGQAFDISSDSGLAREIVKNIILAEQQYSFVRVQKIVPYTKHLHLSILIDNNYTSILFPGVYH